jgi:hypothetical protein
MTARFSLRWILAATAYAALAAAAVGRQSDALATWVWTITILVAAYVFLTACVARGERRFAAAGFALLFAINSACMYLAPSHLPSTSVFVAAGYEYRDGDDAMLRYDSTTAGLGSGGISYIPAAIVRTSNALGALAAGLVGSFLGIVAWRRHRASESAASHATPKRWPDE